MDCLIVFLGGSFRLGGQGTTSIGTNESYDEQIKACKSHIEFIKDLLERKNYKPSVYVSSYTTKYNESLFNIYSDYLVGFDLYDTFIGFNGLLHNTVNRIKDINKYEFIAFIRIDLFLKSKFLEIFNPGYPEWNKILFPTICWYQHSIVDGYPRVNDMMIYLPKRYFKYAKYFIYDHHNGHDLWANLVRGTDLTNSDLGVMIDTYHDSDSAKDYNPLYYIVNRPICLTNHSEGKVFIRPV